MQFVRPHISMRQLTKRYRHRQKIMVHNKVDSNTNSLCGQQSLEDNNTNSLCGQRSLVGFIYLI